MPSMKGSRTERNLLAAFAAGAQASLRYSFYAKQAKREGYEQISLIFQETSDQEKVHAKRLYKLMDGLEAEVTMPLAAAAVASTLENLRRAAIGEARTGEETYPAYAAQAKEEGFTEVALVFSNLARAEQEHGRRYQALAANIESGRVFARPEPVQWRCRHCGWTHTAKAAPERCPACAHPKAHFEINPSNW